MAFRKRNQALGRIEPSLQGPSSDQQPPSAEKLERKLTSIPTPLPYTHPTGTASLDNLFSLPTSYTASSGPGLALGSCLLVQETGTTDYAGVLARCYTAEGLVRGETCHVIGVGKPWVAALPGCVGRGGATDGQTFDDGKERDKSTRGTEGKMKIAWRYEGLSGTSAPSVRASSAARERQPFTIAATDASAGSQHAMSDVPSRRGSHIFDLTKRLELPPNTRIHHHPIPVSLAPWEAVPPFAGLLASITAHLAQSPQSATHRLVVPSLLSPAIPYPPNAALPSHLLTFLHGLRALLRLHSQRLTAFITLPLDLHPRATGLVRAMEHLVDGVIELAPFPHRLSVQAPVSDPGLMNGKKKGAEEEPQGLIRLHKLPVLEERGTGGTGMGNDMAFVVSRRRFDIRLYSLPPEEGDREAQGRDVTDGNSGLPEKKDIEF